jgi:hypothetical protein
LNDLATFRVVGNLEVIEPELPLHVASLASRIVQLHVGYV